MTIQSITLPLSDTIVHRAKQAANVLHRSFEEVISETLAAALPNVDDAPPSMQAELAAMTWLGDQQLWEIARSTMSETQQSEMYRLIELQQQDPLSPKDQIILERLRMEYGRVTLSKARAYALLSLRGGKPLLAAN